MKRRIAIPAFHVTCTVGIDKGRAWSVAEELLLHGVDAHRCTIDDLVAESSLPRTLVVASLARMMRFRLVEVSVTEGSARFGTSRVGAALVAGALPYFPKRVSRRVSFVVDRATGALFRRRDVRLISRAALDRERGQGVDVHVVNVEGGEPEMSGEANLHRLAELSVRAHDEQLATVESRTASRRDDELIVFDVSDGVVTGFPLDTERPLRGLVERLARERTGGGVTIQYAGPKQEQDQPPTAISCEVTPEDVLVGGEAHKQTFLGILERAGRRVVVHSTFLSRERFDSLREAFRAACARGVSIDVLWGAESDDDTISRNCDAAAEIMSAVQDDAVLAGRLHVHMRSTGSHAKVLLSDAPNDAWIAVVGSCNWLLSPFRAVELSAVLHHPRAVAGVARALSRLIARRGAAFDELGTELGLLARALEERPTVGVANGEVTILEGDAHERIARSASGTATRRIVFGSHRLGSTARPGALLQSAAASERTKLDASVIYTRASGPLRSGDARALEEEMTARGVRLVRASPNKLHGKFLVWDDDDVVVTSFNWASASVDAAFPQAELGVHVRGKGVAADVLRRLSEVFPEITGGAASAAPRR
jgi:cardiolipin synthase A/B